MTMFSDRLLFQEEFIKWASIENVEVCPMSVLLYLESEGLINENRMEKWIAETRAMQRAWDMIMQELREKSGKGRGDGR